MAATKQFYVYSLTDPRDDTVFYIGKGRAARKSQHAQKLDIRDDDGSPKAERVREIIDAGYEVAANIIKRFDDEEEAYAFEREEIKKRDGLLNAVGGGGGDRSVPKSKAKAKNITKAEPPKLTPKQEGFCRVYIETGNATEAYRQAYNCSVMKPNSIGRKAHELMGNVKIAARIAELQADHQARHEVTVDSLTGEFEDSRQLAMTTAQPGAANGAVTGKAKLHGLINGDQAGVVNNTQINVAVATTVEKARRIAAALARGANEADA